MHPLITTVSAILLEGLLAGVFVGSAMMEHAARRLEAPDWIAYNQAKDAVYGPVMPVFFGLTLLVSIVVAPFAPDVRLQGGAAVLLLAAGVITGAVHLPLNAIFKAWSAASPPADWDAQRRRWRDWNLLRCALAVLAFAATTGAFAG